MLSRPSKISIFAKEPLFCKTNLADAIMTETQTEQIAPPSETFDASTYLTRRFTASNGIVDEERGVQPFYLQCYHHFYQTFSHTWDPTHAKLLELGGGPVIYPLISAAPFVSEITFADYAEESLELVRLWIRGDPKAHNWTPYFDHVVETLEGKVGESQSRQESLRGKIRKLVSCDIRKEDPSHVVEPSDQLETFDIVSFNLCAEAVCTSVEDYQRTLSRLGKLVSLHGYLTTLVSLEESWYVNEGGKTFVLHLTKEQVKTCLQNAGFTVKFCDTFRIPEKSQGILNDCKGIMFAAATRTD